MRECIIAISIIVLASCNHLNSKKQVSINKLQVLKNETVRLKIDNEDANKFGLEMYSNDESIGIKSILLDSDKVYFVDTYHSNVKCLNLKDNSISASLTLADGSRSWLRDVFVVDSFVYVLSDIGINFILGKDLELINRFFLEPGVKYYVKKEQQVITLKLDGNSFLDLDVNGKLIAKYEGECLNVLELAHGKPFLQLDSLSQHFIKTEFGKVKIDNEFRFLWDYYDGINIDFDNNTLVYFEISQGEYILHIKEF